MTAPRTLTLRVARAIGLSTAVALVAAATPELNAERRGRGLTALVEISYLTTAIDHHFAALRMTELAAGTDHQRDDAITPGEGTSPTPGFSATDPRAHSDDIKSMAREGNRMQREEILRAQNWLKAWYGITYSPRLTAEGKAGIAILEANRGQQFDHKFLEVFSRHHYTIVQRSFDCVVGSDLAHDELKRFCRTIVESQMNAIEDMRHMLCRMFGYCDYVPFSAPDGSHS